MDMRNIRILLTNLPTTSSEAVVASFFESVGFKPTKTEIIYDKLTGQSTGRAFLDFASREEAEKLVNSGLYAIAGQQINLEIASPLKLK